MNILARVSKTFDEITLLSLILLSLPLSIVAAEFFGICFVIVYFVNARFNGISPSALNILVVVIIVVNYASLILTKSTCHAASIASQSLYLIFIPLASSLMWDEHKYLKLLRYYIYGQTANACVGLVEASGVHVINTFGQGHLGLVNFHIWSSMMLALALLILTFDYIQRKVIQSLIYRSAIFLLLLWQLVTTTGRTGQAVYIICVFMIFAWSPKKVRTVLYLSFMPIMLSVFFLSRTLRGIWLSAYGQVSELLHHGSAVTSVGLRVLYAKASWDMLKSHPLFGVGIGNFRSCFYNLVSDGMLPYVPHSLSGVIGPTNSYLLYSSEFGLIGLVSLLAFLILVFIKAEKSSSVMYKRISLLIFAWMIIGSFSDVIISTWCLIIPFAILIAADPGNA